MQKMRQIGLSFCVRKSRKFYHRFIGTMFLFQMLMARKAFAAGLAWEDTLDVFVESITGPVARGVSILACCTLGGLLLFSEVGGMAKRIVQAIFGIACILYAAQIIATIGG